MLRRCFLTTAVLLTAGTLAPSIAAAAESDPAALINNLGSQFQAVTRNTSPEQKRAAFRELFRENFDGRRLGRFVLGRFWRILTPPERREFLALFENYVVLTYSEKLSKYAEDGGGPRVTGTRPGPVGTIVSTEIIGGSGPRAGGGQMAQPIKIDWLVTEKDGACKIRDVIIDGLSLAANGRSELEGVVERNGGRAQAILAVMRQQIASAAR
jgi:phospholipid transport system substrate-binding protein